jgi:hypothetical protein
MPNMGGLLIIYYLLFIIYYLLFTIFCCHRAHTQVRPYGNGIVFSILN